MNIKFLYCSLALLNVVSLYAAEQAASADQLPAGSVRLEDLAIQLWQYINQQSSATTLPPESDVKKTVVQQPTRLCRVCGQEGKNQCAQCKRVFYCSRECQRYDWETSHKRLKGLSSLGEPLEDNQCISECKFFQDHTQFEQWLDKHMTENFYEPFTKFITEHSTGTDRDNLYKFSQHYACIPHCLRQLHEQGQRTYIAHESPSNLEAIQKYREAIEQGDQDAHQRLQENEIKHTRHFAIIGHQFNRYCVQEIEAKLEQYHGNIVAATRVSGKAPKSPITGEDALDDGTQFYFPRHQQHFMLYVGKKLFERLFKALNMNTVPYIYIAFNKPLKELISFPAGVVAAQQVRLEDAPPSDGQPVPMVATTALPYQAAPADE